MSDDSLPLSHFYKPDRKKRKISEVELAQPIIKWLIDQNWNVYQEVEFRGRGGVADIVAERHGILWIIECKTSYTMQVLQQASRWPVHYRSVAIPKAMNRDNRDYRVAQFYYEVGVIDVDLWAYDSRVYESVPPKLFIRHNTRYKEIKKYLASLTELHKTYAQAGARSGNHLTAYKQTMLEIKKFIGDNPGCTINELHGGLGNMHYYSKDSFRGNVIKCLDSFESEWCRIDTSQKPYKLYIR
jgi:hypothetical protein